MTTLAQIVAALSVTYNDQGVAVWLASRNRGLAGAAPIDVIARDPGGIEHVADLVRGIGDADPRLFTMREDGEERPEDTVRRYARMIEAALEWIARADPYPGLNGDHFAGLRRILSGMPDRCDRCHRPLPHNNVEQRVCNDLPVSAGGTDDEEGHTA